METPQNPTAAPDPLGLLVEEEVANDFLRCTPRMVRKLTETRQLESVKVGSLVRYERAAVERYIASRRRPAS
jgi:excisionase family DNA binding protein